MSFTHRTKQEVCRQKSARGFGYIWGMLLFGSAYHSSAIGLHTEHGMVAKRYAHAVSQAVPMEGSVTLREVPKAQRRSVYTVSVDDANDRRRLLEAYPAAADFQLASLPEREYRGFLTGAYLSCGSVWDPEKGYRAEFLTDDPKAADILETLLTAALCEPKRTLRRNSYLLYYADSGQVEDLLAYVGAVKSAFQLMDVKILRDVRNQANRRTNCDTANISKTVDAAMRQCQAVEQLRSSPLWNSLDPSLQAIATVRLENPQASLRELCSLLPENLSRSTLNRRLNQLLSLVN